MPAGDPLKRFNKPIPKGRDLELAQRSARGKKPLLPLRRNKESISLPEGESPDRVRLSTSGIREAEQEGDTVEKLTFPELAEKYRHERSSTKRTSLSLGFQDAVNQLLDQELLTFEVGDREKNPIHQSTKRWFLQPFMLAWLAPSILAIGIAVTVLLVGATTGSISLNEATPLPPTAAVPAQSVAQVLEACFGAKKWQDLLPYVRNPDRIEPLMEDWYATQHWEPTPFEILETREGFTPLSSQSQPRHVWAVHANLRFLSPQTSYPNFALLERTAEGYKLDWEALVDNTQVSFEMFISSRLDTSLSPEIFRISVEPDDYFNFDFSSRKAWKCYRISSPFSNSSVVGYTRQGSTVQETLDSFFYEGESSIPVMAELLFPDRMSKFRGQVEITNVIQKNWLVETKPTEPDPILITQ